MAATRHSGVWQLPTAVVVELILRLAQMEEMAVVVVGLELPMQAEQAHTDLMAALAAREVAVEAEQTAQAVAVVVVAVRLVQLEERQARELAALALQIRLQVLRTAMAVRTNFAVVVVAVCITVRTAQLLAVLVVDTQAATLRQVHKLRRLLQTLAVVAVAVQVITTQAMPEAMAVAAFVF